MLKFKKVLNLKIASLLIALVFIFENAAYSVSYIEYNKANMRVPMGVSHDRLNAFYNLRARNLSKSKIRDFRNKLYNRLNIDQSDISKGNIRVTINQKEEIIPVEFGSLKNELKASLGIRSFLRVGPLIFLECSPSENAEELRNRIGLELFNQYGSNIIFYVSQDENWGVTNSTYYSPVPFISGWTIAVIGIMLKIDPSKDIIIDIGAGRGIFEVLELRFGAKYIYGVERIENNILLATRVLEINGYPPLDSWLYMNEHIRLFNHNIYNENKRTLGLMEYIPQKATMFVANIGPAYGNLHLWVIRKAGKSPLVKKLIIGGYGGQPGPLKKNVIREIQKNFSIIGEAHFSFKLKIDEKSKYQYVTLDAYYAIKKETEALLGLERIPRNAL